MAVFDERSVPPGVRRPKGRGKRGIGMEYNNEYNLDLYPKKLHWKEGDLTATRTTMWLSLIHILRNFDGSTKFAVFVPKAGTAC